MSSKLYGLLGKNISYSRSPDMHNAAFRHFGIDVEYVLFDKGEDELEEFFGSALKGEISGFNVTVPHKIKIREMLKFAPSCSLDAVAEILGAVNTVKCDGGELEGFNTDGRGFLESLQEDTGFDPAGKTVLVMGAGGASRAISLYLASALAITKKVFVFDIDKERSSSLVSAFKGTSSGNILSAIEEEDIPTVLAEADLVVNATPLGTREGDPSPVSAEYLHKGLVVYDLVYARQTELVKEARKKGLTAVDGLGMLINQAALAFNIWTAKPLDEVKKVMKEAAGK